MTVLSSLATVADRLGRSPAGRIADRVLTAATSPVAPGPDDPVRRLSDELGHSVHPLAVVVPLGLWSSASLLDVIGGRGGRGAATRLVGLGVVAAGPTAYSGLASWVRLEGEERRIGAVHALTNDVAIVLFASSWLARVRGDHWRGVRLALLGNLTTAAAGHLGGVLALERGTARRP